MTDPSDFFKDHPAAADFETFMQHLNNPKPMNSPKPMKKETEVTYAWRYGYLRGIVQEAMYLNNRQEMKDKLMSAIEYLEKR